MKDKSEKLSKLEIVLEGLNDDDRKFIEGYISQKNIEIRNLQNQNKALLTMISDVWEIVQNILSNTNTNIKSIVRVLQPVLSNNNQ